MKTRSDDSADASTTTRCAAAASTQRAQCVSDADARRADVDQAVDAGHDAHAAHVARHVDAAVAAPLHENRTLVFVDDDDARPLGNDDVVFRYVLEERLGHGARDGGRGPDRGGGAPLALRVGRLVLGGRARLDAGLVLDDRGRPRRRERARVPTKAASAAHGSGASTDAL